MDRDLIDRNELVKKLGPEYKETVKLIKSGETHLDSLAEGYKEVFDLIMHAPTVNAKPVRCGHWKWFEEWSESNAEHYAECEDAGWECSVCDKSLADIVGGYWDDMNDIPKLNYCPYCGAKMEDNE